MIRPSSLPMVAQCPQFRGTGGSDADAGTARHKALYKLLAQNDQLLLANLPEEDAEAVQWAADFINLKAPKSDYPLECEVTRTWLRPDFSEASGTPDVTCGPVMFDLKTRQRDYSAQMADYALSLLQSGHDRVTVHLLFTSGQRVQEMLFDRESAEETVQRVLDAAGNGEPRVCDYCGWCERAASCAPHIAQAQTTAKGYTADPRVESWHPSEMKTGEELAYALWVWRTVLKKWGESVEYHARESALTRGLTLSCKVAEFELKTKAGKTYTTDVAQAFALAGLPQDEFLKCCDLRLTTSKKYPDKRGIANAYAGLHGMKLAPAKRALLGKLGDVVKQTPETVYLGAKKAGADEDESE